MDTTHDAPHDHDHDHEHGGHTHTHDHAAPRAEASPPTDPSRAVIVDVGEHTGALVLTASSAREGLEVEIHPVAEPSKRTHVWVLPRTGRDGTIFAAVFPSLAAGDYVVLDIDGTPMTTVSVPANRVTSATWGELDPALT
jgi:ABC-type Zn2+ transport system substrate-binding protein/surface adhesin